MAENTRLKELQAKIENQGAEIRRLMDLMELRDQEQRAHTDQVQADARQRMESFRMHWSNSCRIILSHMVVLL